MIKMKVELWIISFLISKTVLKSRRLIREV